MKNLKIILLLILLFQLSGCIVFHSVSYEVNINEDGTGTALLSIKDINSDATTKEALDEDVKNIMEYAFKSKEFLDGMEAEGKQTGSRDIYVEDGKLNATLSYSFFEINRVEGMQFDDPYYYLTIPAEDSIISTNGQITKTAEYKRIVWDKSIKTLKFTMFSDNTNREGLTSLAKFYQKED
jgi:hypothetical protein